MFPVESASNAIAYETGYLSLKEMIKTGFVLDLIGILLVNIFIFSIILWVLGCSSVLPYGQYNHDPDGSENG